MLINESELEWEKVNNNNNNNNNDNNNNNMGPIYLNLKSTYSIKLSFNLV